ncbi:MAG: hypothetical protein AB1772_12250 [Candidatus Zixiibacteriota bacterium]
MAVSLEAISLKVDTPTGQPVPGRGFYQLEEDALYVQVGEYHNNRGFFNYLESEYVRFDIDKTGCLMLIEVSLPRRHWVVDPRFAPPTIAEPADIRWLDFRARFPEPRLVTNAKQTALHLQFSTGTSWRWYGLAEAVLLQVDQNHNLAGMLITGIEDDLAGRQIAAFRRETQHLSRGPSKSAPSRRTISG